MDSNEPYPFSGDYGGLLSCKNTATNQEQEKWPETPLASAIEKKNQVDALAHGFGRKGSSPRQEVVQSEPGSGEGGSNVDEVVRLPVETALNNLPFTIQYKDDPKLGSTGQSIPDPQVMVNAAAGNTHTRACRRGKRSRTAPNPPDKPLLTEEEAAYVLDLEPESLAVFRSTGRHQIPFIKIGRNVRYRRSDLDAWLISHTHVAGVTGKEESL